MIARICDSSVADVQPKFENLERQHIVAISELKSETIFEFRHDFFRQVAYTMTLSSDRRVLHAKTLRAAEVLFDNRISDWIAFLAYHAALASLHADAARYCRIAAEHAVHASSYSAATEFCEQAVKHLDQLPQTVENIQASIDVRLLLRVAAGGTSDFQSWLHHLTKSIELAEQIGDMSRRLLALIHRTWALNFSSSAVDAVRAGEAAVGLAQALRIPSSEALARFALGQAHYVNGGYRDAIETLTPASQWLAQGREMERLGTTGTTLVLTHMMQANSFAAMGHFQAAERELSRLEDLANQTGRAYDQVALSYCRGMVLGGQAKLDPTINTLEHAYELCRRHGSTCFCPSFRLGLSAALVTARNIPRAREVALVGVEVADLATTLPARPPRPRLPASVSPKAILARPFASRAKRVRPPKPTAIAASRLAPPACWLRPSWPAIPATSATLIPVARGHRARGDHRGHPVGCQLRVAPGGDFDQEWPTRGSAEILPASDRRDGAAGYAGANDAPQGSPRRVGWGRGSPPSYWLAASVGGASSRNCCTVRNNKTRFFSIRMVWVPSLRMASRFQAALVSNGNSVCAI